MKDDIILYRGNVYYPKKTQTHKETSRDTTQKSAKPLKRYYPPAHIQSYDTKASQPTETLLRNGPRSAIKRIKTPKTTSPMDTFTYPKTQIYDETLLPQNIHVTGRPTNEYHES